MTIKLAAVRPISGDRIDASTLRKDFFVNPPVNEQYRTYFGRATDMRRIENAIRNANDGALRDITDLAGETIDTDPHLASVLTKRFGALQAADWDVCPAASHDETQQERAKEYATFVSAVLRDVHGFRGAIGNLAWGIFHGRAALETDWRFGESGRKWSVGRLTQIHPNRLTLGPDRELRVVDWLTSSGFQQIGTALRDYPFKFIEFKPQLFNEYAEREGLARRCLYWSFMKRFSARGRMILTELFGAPWRIMSVDPDGPTDAAVLDEASAMVESLGSTTTARLPKGISLNVEWPSERSGDIYSVTIADVDKQISKLVLGQTMTTEDGASLSQSQVHQGEQDLIFKRDARMVSEAIQDQLIVPLIALNFGPAALALAPQFQIKTTPEKDRLAETARLKAVLDLGVAVSLSEVYEITGIRQPTEEESVVQMLDGNTLLGTPTRLRVTEHNGDSEESEEVLDDVEAAPEPTAVATNGAAIVLTPTDLATIITVNEGRASAGLGPLVTSDGALDPEGLLSITEYKAKHASLIQDVSVAETATAPTQAKFELDTSGKSELFATNPSKVYGSPESISDGGVRDGAVITTQWAEHFVRHVGDTESESEILTKLNAAAKAVPLRAFADMTYRRLLHGAMLGALDSAWEAENDGTVAPATFAENPSFATKPFRAAIEFFKKKNVVTKDLFTAMDKAAKERAFTVATLARDEMLSTAKAALQSSLESGATLRTFSKDLGARFESAGWTKLKPSHVENVFRTNTMGAYGKGRRDEMTQSAVLAARPYWQIMGVNDSRTRETHRAVLNKALRADDPFWKDAYPPWSFSCRCRIVSRSQRDIDSRDIQVISGSSIRDLPEEGFK